MTKRVRECGRAKKCRDITSRHSRFQLDDGSRSAQDAAKNVSPTIVVVSVAPVSISRVSLVALASTIGMEDRIRLVEGRRYHLPDGSDRFLVDAAMLQRVTAALGGDFIEPIKTTVVENMRAMTTWVVRKR